MEQISRVRAVLFAKDLARVVSFYAEALGLGISHSDEHHALLRLDEFELIVHQIPTHIAQGIEISDPPMRREAGAIRLDYPVAALDQARRVASALGGLIDDAPPAWADPDLDFFLGHDPEGNVFGVSQRAA